MPGSQEVIEEEHCHYMSDISFCIFSFHHKDHWSTKIEISMGDKYIIKADDKKKDKFFRNHEKVLPHACVSKSDFV